MGSSHLEDASFAYGPAESPRCCLGSLPQASFLLVPRGVGYKAACGSLGCCQPGKFAFKTTHLESIVRYC